jgi:hypothetical protein
MDAAFSRLTAKYTSQQKELLQALLSHPLPSIVHAQDRPTSCSHGRESGVSSGKDGLRSRGSSNNSSGSDRVSRSINSSSSSERRGINEEGRRPDGDGGDIQDDLGLGAPAAFDPAELERFLNRLSDIDVAANGLLEEAGVLKGNRA